ncbi:MAG TPA: hypothetical protein VJ817_17105 [Gemmatimonadales bacterium]|nr:hypothetical protein [Gemmatimonadales bacterium]
MVSQAEYEAVIEAFMMEMSAICIAKSEADLRAIPGFLEEVAESAALMRQALDSPAELLPLSFGVIDEFVSSNHAEVIRECYALYMDMQGGASHRHPTASS